MDIPSRDIKTRALYREIKKYVHGQAVNSLDLSRDLQRTAGVYRDLVSARDDDPAIQRSLDGIRELGAKPLLPALISVYQTCSEVDDRRRLVAAALSLYVRHTVIGNLESTRLETFVYNAAKELRNGTQLQRILSNIVAFAPTDEQFRGAFRRAQIGRAATARYVLRQLEQAVRRTRELRVDDVPERVNLEHIYSKSPNAGDRLPNHDLIVNRLGNLTLLDRRLNDAVRNGSFAAKKPYYSQSELALTRGLGEFPAWDENAIDERPAADERSCITDMELSYVMFTAADNASCESSRRPIESTLCWSQILALRN